LETTGGPGEILAKKSVKHGTKAWIGGYVYAGIFYIRKQVSGRRYDFSTGARTLAEAQNHWVAFQQKTGLVETPTLPPPPTEGPPVVPHSTVPPVVQGRKVVMTYELIDAFLRYSTTDKQNCDEWLKRKRRVLLWWYEQLANRDLRTLSYQTQILAALNSVGGHINRLKILYGFYSYLVTTEILGPAEHVMVRKFKQQKAKPEQWRKTKALSAEEFKKVRSGLARHWRDAFDVQMATGWHRTELERFVRGGAVHGNSTIECPQAKSGEPLIRPVSKGVWEAAKRLVERGTLSKKRYYLSVKEAAKAAGVPWFSPGYARHTFASRAVHDFGVDPKDVSEWLGHKSPDTVKRFYIQFKVPKKMKTLI